MISSDAYETLVIDANPDELQALRSESVGGSSIRELFPELDEQHPHMSPGGVRVRIANEERMFLEKTGRGEPRKTATERALAWGNLMENPIIEMANGYYDREIRPWQSMVRSKEWPWITCTPDAVEGESLVQIKTSVGRLKHKWQHLKTSRIDIDTALGLSGLLFRHYIPWQYILQQQHEMAVTGAKEHRIVVVFTGDDKPFDFRPTKRGRFLEGIPDMDGFVTPRNDAIIEEIVARSKAFMERVREYNEHKERDEK